MEHCCKEISAFLEEDKVAIVYLKKFRAYYINLKSSDAIQQIYYCPWCGLGLPEALDTEYESELSKALAADIDELDSEDLNAKYLPSEFKTDEWWKKRGL
jgi:hypothetical protein